MLVCYAHLVLEQVLVDHDLGAVLVVDASPLVALEVRVELGRQLIHVHLEVWLPLLYRAVPRRGRHQPVVVSWWARRAALALDRWAVWLGQLARRALLATLALGALGRHGGELRLDDVTGVATYLRQLRLRLHPRLALRTHDLL
eukprot:1179420-Prorocentrum_minimum.AAC.1